MSATLPETKEQALLLKRLKRIKTLKSRNSLVEEQLMAQQQMLDQTTSYLVKLQRDLQDKNDSITESIAYARYIQNAILPEQEVLTRHFADSAIYYQPHSIVSGDLPWVKVTELYTLAAAIDCSGHGVPGAMLTMMAYSLMNEISGPTGVTEPAELLSQLDRQWTDSIRKTVDGTQISESMDIALVRYDPRLLELKFAGAKRPLFLCRDGQITELDGGDTSVSASDDVHHFSSQTVQLIVGDIIYLFTDGITDQFGDGEASKKFTKRRLRELLVQHTTKPLAAQREALANALADWKGASEQTDDMLLLAFQV
jgi:phosphoserine phosphatase RsbU/P